ncbi:MAG: porin family protein [Thermodesulfobacteriota bacterium]
MKKIVLFLAMFMPFCFQSNADAFYGGVSFVSAKVDFGDYDAGVGLLAIKGGQELHENIAVEGRLGIGIADGDIKNNSVSVDLNYYYGIYCKAKHQIDRFSLYALLGLAGAEVELESNVPVPPGFPSTASESDAGLSYGVGVEFMATDKLGVNLEYLVLPDIEDVEIQSIGLGVSFQF